MNVIVNGETREMPADTTLSAMIELLGLPDERIAIELNKAVIRRSRWDEAVLSDGDAIEIVHFVGGG